MSTPLNEFNFEKLRVYQKALDYIDFAYNLSSLFPKQEQFELGKQFRRAAHSVAANIGEGERGTKWEFSNFLRIAHRSANECVVHTTVAFRRKYITSEQNEQTRNYLAEIARMITVLRATVEKGRK